MKKLLILFFISGLVTAYERPSVYQFPARDMITMDVVKNDGYTGGGTYRCTSIYNCYMYVKSAEARGATQYCQTITIKRNGRPVWFKKYQ